MARSVPEGVSLARARIAHAEEYYDLLVYEFDPMGGYRLRPNQRLPHVTINEDGFRGAGFRGDERVLLLGDSVTFGVGAPDDDSRFARYLEQAAGIGVADASVRAYRVFQHYAKLPELLARLPGVRGVLLWAGYADLLYWALRGGCLEGAFDFEWKYDPQAVRLSGSRIRQALFFASRRWSERVNGWLGGAPQRRPRTRGAVEDLAASVAVHARAIADLCAGRGLAFALLLQPFLRERPGSAELRRFMDLDDQKIAQRCGQPWYRVAPAFAATLAEALQGVRMVDCQPLVEEQDFLDHVHVRDAAQRRLAERLLEQPALEPFWEHLGVRQGHAAAGVGRPATGREA
jgi:hypothetical protein